MSFTRPIVAAPSEKKLTRVAAKIDSHPEDVVQETRDPACLACMCIDLRTRTLKSLLNRGLVAVLVSAAIGSSALLLSAPHHNDLKIMTLNRDTHHFRVKLASQFGRNNSSKTFTVELTDIRVCEWIIKNGFRSADPAKQRSLAHASSAPVVAIDQAGVCPHVPAPRCPAECGRPAGPTQ